MAKVKDPFGARDARGSVGGITATQNSMGKVLKSKTSPVQPRTATQQARRYTLQKLTRLFQNLSPVHIQNWIDFASNWPVTDVFGDSITITGMNWYVALNSRLDSLGVSLHLDPPLNPNPSYNPEITFQQHVSTGDITIQFSVSIPDGGAIWVQYSNNLPRTSLFAKKSLKQRAILDYHTSLTHTLIDYSLLSPDDSLVQFTAFAVDEFGRATPKIRDTVYPLTV